jgi:rhodanese-related sulfurtransferase
MYEQISAMELASLQKEQPVIVIDMRNPEMYHMGHVVGSFNIPLQHLLANPTHFLNKETTYYLMCQTGSNTSYVASQLARLGYQVVEVIGGYRLWPEPLTTYRHY